MTKKKDDQEMRITSRNETTYKLEVNDIVYEIKGPLLPVNTTILIFEGFCNYLKGLVKEKEEK